VTFIKVGISGPAPPYEPETREESSLTHNRRKRECKSLSRDAGGNPAEWPQAKDKRRKGGGLGRVEKSWKKLNKCKQGRGRVDISLGVSGVTILKKPFAEVLV